jgi:N-acetyl-anhydromuramyl-L-alanine amidase AmpD
MPSYPLAVKMHLPEFCYSTRQRPIAGAVVHYFSCIYADPDRWADPRRCWELFHDLNCQPAERRYRLYNGPKVYASAGYLIDRDGVAYELAPLGAKTWHAGESLFRGREDCNSFMEGIEMIAAPQVDPVLYGYSEKQYWSLAMLLRWLMLEHRFQPRDITGHDVVRKAWRDAHPQSNAVVKTDPGTYAAPPWFDWPKVLIYTGTGV